MERERDIEGKRGGLAYNIAALPKGCSSNSSSKDCGFLEPHEMKAFGGGGVWGGGVDGKGDVMRKGRWEEMDGWL